VIIPFLELHRVSHWQGFNPGAVMLAESALRAAIVTKFPARPSAIAAFNDHPHTTHPNVGAGSNGTKGSIQPSSSVLRGSRSGLSSPRAI
jgi:hypothetical protein